MAYLRKYRSGQWQAVVRRCGTPHQSATFPTRSEASRWARQIESEIDQGVFIDRHESQRITIESLIDRYLRGLTGFLCQVH